MVGDGEFSKPWTQGVGKSQKGGGDVRGFGLTENED